MKRADIVIIGGGIIGVSIAFYLAKKKCSNIVLLEKNDLLGAETTTAAAGGARHQWRAQENIAFAKESISVFKNFADELGVKNAEEIKEIKEKIGFDPIGYAFLISDQKNLKMFKENVAKQKSLGINVAIISPKELKKRIPILETDDLIAATFCPEDCVVDPAGLTELYAKYARVLGVEIIKGVEVKNIKIKGNQIKKVLTNKEEIVTSRIVNAAGPWANVGTNQNSGICQMVGIDLSVKPFLFSPERHQRLLTEPMEGLPEQLPMVVDINGLYMRREGQGFLMGMANENEPSSFNTKVDQDFLWEILATGAERLPILEEARLDIGKAVAGLYANTADKCAILGEYPGLKGFYLACGFSGHGLMHAPAVGKVMAELIIDGKASTLDIYPFSIDAFKTKKRPKEQEVI